MTELLLYLVSRICEKLLSGFFFWWGVVRSAYKSELRQYLKQVAIVNDVDLNVTGQYFLNDTMRLSGPQAGNRLQTVSCWMGMAQLNKWGLKWKSWLNRLDKDHCLNAVKFHRENIAKEAHDLAIDQSINLN